MRVESRNGSVSEPEKDLLSVQAVSLRLVKDLQKEQDSRMEDMRHINVSLFLRLMHIIVITVLLLHTQYQMQQQ